MATKHLPPWGSQPLRSEGQNQKWPTSGQGGYITPTAYGFPSASERGGKIRSGAQVGHVATKPLLPWGSPPLQSGGQKQKWPTSRPHGYQTPAALGLPTASERVAKSEVAYKWARWLHNPCRLGGPHRFVAGGQNQKWPTSRPHGYQTPAALGVPTASERVAKSEVAYKWARWLHNPCRLGGPHRFIAGGKIKSGPQVGQMATKHLPPWGSQPLRSEGQNQKWPTSEQGGYITPTAYGFPSASERGGKIRSGAQVGHVATKPLPPWRSPPLQSGGQNQKWPTSRPHGYQTPAALWVRTASERGAKSEVAHKWARWLHNPCRPRGPHHFRAGGKIRSGPQVGQMATKHLPPWGSQPLQSGGQKQKWPKSGDGGYINPAA